jgi:NAD(P)H dehydrogenase (quinone)
MMQDINVLVVFYSRTGRTEKLALAAALGAVQAKANIRLRWLREAADDWTIDGVAGWRENLERMEKEYIAPRPVDAEWADVIIIGVRGAPPELRDYLGSLDGKVETVFIDAEDARLQGRQVAEAARAMKTMAPGPQSSTSD